MAFELGAIIARIKADTSDFKKGINDAKGDLDGFNNFMGKSASAARGLVTGLAALGAGVVAIGGFAVKSAASLEQTRIGFEGLIGDGTKAGNLMRDLSKFAAETPFEFPELAKSARLLMAFGDTAEEVLPHLRIIGDTVSTMGGGAPEIDRVTRAIGQMAAKGKITAEEMNQLSEIGVNGFKLLAQGTGKTEAELRKMSETGTLMAKDMLPVLYEQMQKNYGGGMEAQSKSLIGMWSTLRDELSMFGRELIGMNNDGSIVKGGVFDTIKTSMAGFLEWLLANKDTIKAGIKTAFEWVQQYLPIIIGILGTLLVAAFASAAAAAVTFMASLAPLILIGAALGAAFMLLQPHFGTIFGWLNDKLAPAFSVVKGFIEQMIPVVMNIANTMIANFVPALMAVGNFLINLWQMILPGLLIAWGFLQPAFAQLADVIINQLWPALQNLWAMLVQLWQNVAPVLIPALQILGTILGVIITAAIWLVVTALSFVIGVISDVINWVSGLGTIFAAVINAIIVIVTIVGAVIGAIFMAAIAIVTGLIVGLGNIFRVIFNTIANVISGVVSLAIGLWNAFSSTVTGIIQGVASFIGSIMRGDVVGAFRGAIDSAKSIFSTLTGHISGIINGVISTVARVRDGIVAPFRDAVNTIKGLMDGAKNALSNLNPFQRHSPSLVDWVRRGTKVIADEYGDLSNSIAAGSVAARIETIGTARSFASVSAAQVAVQGSGGKNSGNYTINLTGVLADSPEAKRRLGTELVKLINDGLEAKGKGTIPV